jgi:uncharacterized membrane protein YqjE
MHESNFSTNGERSLASIVIEIREELKSLVTTRIEMLKSELRDAVAAIKSGVPFALGAAVMLGTAYLLLTLALVALIVVAFGANPYRWFFSLLIVGGLWLMTGGMAAFFALRRLQLHGFFPRRTVEVLKADKAWIQNEIGGSL